MTNPLLTPKEASNLLSISLSTLYRLKDRGYLPFYTIGSGLRFDMADLDQFLEANRMDLKRKDNVYSKNQKRLVD